MAIVEEPTNDPSTQSSASGIIIAYLMERVHEYRVLDAIRQQCWNDASIDEVFEKRRQKADNADKAGQKSLFDMMLRNGEELAAATVGFDDSVVDPENNPFSIVDFCMAPGACLHTALHENPGSRALAFTLPVEMGGHEVWLPYHDSVDVKFMDINLLAEDMGAVDIPEHHEEASQFIPRVLTKGRRPFNLALCDGQVLRTHARAPYRERREAQRLTSVQLALGLGHLKEGGTMVVLLHKVEAWRTVILLHLFSKFSNVQLFKPSKSHTTRSSFYMIASNIKVLHPEAIEAVEQWKKMWQAATFGTEEDFQETFQGGSTPEEVLDEFGDTLVETGTAIWKIQGDALIKRTEKGW